MKFKISVGLMLVFVACGLVGDAVSEIRPQAYLLKKKAERFIEQGASTVWRVRDPHARSLREKVEELYFEDSGTMLSALSLEERQGVMKEYLGGLYERLKYIILDSFDKEEAAEARVDIASFMASELFDESLLKTNRITFAELDIRSQDEYLLALGYCGHAYTEDFLKRRLFDCKKRNQRSVAELATKKMMYESQQADVKYNLYDIREMINTALLAIDEDAAQHANSLEAQRIAQALRFSDETSLGIVVALSGLQDDPALVLEVFKCAVSRGQEVRFAESILGEYAALNRDLTAYEAQLLRWVCLVIDQCKQGYKGNDNIIIALDSLAKRKEYWAKFASRALGSLTSEGAGGTDPIN